MQDYESYVSWHIKENITVIECRIRMELDIGRFIEVGGEISRVDLLPDRYRGTLLSTSSIPFSDELRFPLIQLYLSIRYQRPLSECSIALQSLNGSGLSETSFDQGTIDEAVDELGRIGEIVKKHDKVK